MSEKNKEKLMFLNAINNPNQKHNKIIYHDLKINL